MFFTKFKVTGCGGNLTATEDLTTLNSPGYPEERLKYNLDCKYALFSLKSFIIFGGRKSFCGVSPSGTSGDVYPGFLSQSGYLTYVLLCQQQGIPEIHLCCNICPGLVLTVRFFLIATAILLIATNGLYRT